MFCERVDAMGPPSSEWNWHNAVRDRGMHRIERPLGKALKMPGQRWQFFMSGKKYFNASMVCLWCHGMYVASTETSKFSAEDETELATHLLLEDCPELQTPPSAWNR